MNKSLNILLVDDHPLITDSYINVITNLAGVALSTIEVAETCLEAYYKINRCLKSKKLFNLAIIDERIPACNIENINSGSALAVYLKKNMPLCIIIIIAGHSEVLKLYDIYKTVSPEGLLVKSDLNIRDLSTTFQAILSGEKIYSKTVKKIWNHHLLNNDVNRNILVLVSKGYQLEEIGSQLFLSKSAVQKRILKLKQSFEVESINDMLKLINNNGYI